jgi:hypothetical protein
MERDKQILWSMLENVFLFDECVDDIKAIDDINENLSRVRPVNETHEVAVFQDPSHDYMKLSESDLEIILDHIVLCTHVNNEIRWDLLAEILFPCDDYRQKLLLENTLLRKSVEKNLLPANEPGNQPANTNADVAQERARAVFSISNHDLNVASSHDFDLTECDNVDLFMKIVTVPFLKIPWPVSILSNIRR